MLCRGLRRKFRKAITLTPQSKLQRLATSGSWKLLTPQTKHRGNNLHKNDTKFLKNCQTTICLYLYIQEKESIPRSYNSKQLLMEWEIGENSVRFKIREVL